MSVDWGRWILTPKRVASNAKSQPGPDGTEPKTLWLEMSCGEGGQKWGVGIFAPLPPIRRLVQPGSHPYGLLFTHETYEKNKDAWLKQPPKLWEEVMGRKNSRSSTYGAWDLSSHRSPFTLG